MNLASSIQWQAAHRRGKAEFDLSHSVSHYRSATLDNRFFRVILLSAETFIGVLIPKQSTNGGALITQPSRF
jgi:hypothetical protein